MISVIFNQLDKAILSDPINPPYMCFYVFPGPCHRSGPFFYLEAGVLDLRQEEAAFFTLCEPWSSRLERDNLGVRKFIEWEALKPSPIPISRWARLCAVLKRVYWPSTRPNHQPYGIIPSIITSTLALTISVYIIYLAMSFYR